uniref:Uncharacterized protein n=1 Tax=Anguilla anguilla TaxID=7936 RepID=A0A0E9WLU6_ANGAN
MGWVGRFKGVFTFMFMFRFKFNAGFIAAAEERRDGQNFTKGPVAQSHT